MIDLVDVDISVWMLIVLVSYYGYILCCVWCWVFSFR